MSNLNNMAMNWLFGKSANNDMIFTNEHIICYGNVAMNVGNYGSDLLSLTRINHLVPISLTKSQVYLILAIIDYYNFMYWNRDKALADPQIGWDTEIFEDWKRNGRPTSEHYIQLEKRQEQYILARVDHTASTVATTTTTATEIRTRKVNSNLNVATDDVVDDDNINNAKSPPERENSIGDSDGIQDEYYQDDSSSNSTDDVATAVMKEDEDSRDEFQSSTVYVSVPVSVTTTTPVFTDIESNGEIVSKDVAAADDDIDNAKSPKIGDLDGINDEYYQERENINNNETATSTIITDIVSNKEVVTTDDVEIDNAKIQSSKVPVTITAPEIVSNKEVISGNSAEKGTNGVADDDDTVATTTTTPVFTEDEISNNLPDKDSKISTNLTGTNLELNINNSKEEENESDDANSNLNVADDFDEKSSNLLVDDTDDDDIDNAESPPEYENSTGVLDGIKDEYSQPDGKYCSVYDRSNDDNPPSLPPESPANAIDIQCIHSNIPNDGDH